MDSMTSTTDKSDTRPAVIRHPVWCARVAEDASLAGDPVGSPTFYDRLEMPEPDNEHRGMAYQMEAGGALDSVIVQLCALYELDGARQRLLDEGPAVKLSIVMRESVGSATAHLAIEDVDQLLAILQRARNDLEEAMGTATAALLTLDQAAAVLGRPVSAVRRLVDARELTCVRIHRRVFVRQVDVDAFVADRG